MPRPPRNWLEESSCRSAFSKALTDNAQQCPCGHSQTHPRESNAIGPGGASCANLGSLRVFYWIHVLLTFICVEVDQFNANHCCIHYKMSSAVKDNVNIASFVCENASEVMGINDKKQLSQAERSYQMRQAEDLMSSGLTIMDPRRFDCRGDLNFGDDCTIDVNVVFEGDNVLGKNVTCHPVPVL